ncbi:Chitobiase/beta-hexosaminidase C-terminal domain protein [Cryptosporidium felis]|nr:Chitobiase/beta-hexosaminidase C-terminal domain protein [Cryptosporidium felis]
MVICQDNIKQFVGLKRSIESVLAKVDHRLELIERSKNEENLTLGNIAHIALRYSSTTRAPPEYDDLTGKELSKRPGYCFPCPSNAHIQLSQLYTAKQLPCVKPEIKIFETSPDSRRIEICSIQKNAEIIYQLNSSAEQTYSEPIFVSIPGNHIIKAFSRKSGFCNSGISEKTFTIESQLNTQKELNYDVELALKDETKETFTEPHKKHSHSRYKGLHLGRNQAGSSDESDSLDSSDPE